MISTQAHAQQGYVGLDMNFVSMDVAGATFAPMTARGRIGLTILADSNPMISLESHMGFDITDDTQRVQGTPVTLELDTYVGLYVRGDLLIGDRGSAYLSLGMASAQISGPVGTGGLPNDDTESSLSFALGGSYVLPWWGLTTFVEVTQIVNGDNLSITGIGFGVSTKIE